MSSPSWEHLTELPSQLAQQIGAHTVTSMAREGVQAAGAWVDDLLRGQQLVQRTQDRFEKAQASWRWGGHPLGYSQRIPLPAEPDNKMVLAGLALIKVLHDQVSRHGDVGALVTKHPATFGLVLASCAVFFKPGGVLLRDACLSPYCVLERGEWERLLLPALVHLDATHLLANLAAALPDCLALEASSNSLVFSGELVALTATSHATYVLWAWIRKKAFNLSADYYSVGALGLSSLAFALQVVSGERTSASMLLPGGLRMPARFGWIIQLALTHVCAPDSSFAGHLCGVAAGLMHVYGFQPVLRLLGLRLSGVDAERWASASQPRFYGAGTADGRVIVTDAARGRRAWWRRWGLQLASQVSLLALATGVYMLSSRQSRGSRRHSSSMFGAWA